MHGMSGVLKEYREFNWGEDIMIKKRGFVFSVYLIMLISTLLIFVWNISRTTDHQNIMQYSSMVSFSEGWTDEDGQRVFPEKLNLSRNHPTGQQFSIYKQIPADMDLDLTIGFRSNGLSFSVSVDDEVLYTYGIKSAHIFGNSPGIGQHHVVIPSKYAGKTLCISFSTAYNQVYERLFDMYMGNGTSMLKDQVMDKLFAIILCVVLMSIGILYMLLDFPISRIVNTNHSMLYLGMFSLVVATWSGTETHVLDLIVPSTQALHCFSLMLLSLVSIPLGLFLSSSFSVIYPRLLNIGYILSAVGYVVCLILYLSGKADYNQSLIISHVVIVYFLVITINIIAGNLHRKQCVGLEKWLIVISISLMAAGVLTDLVLSKISFQTDNSKFTRVGMTVIVLCFGMVTSLQTMKRFKTATEMEVISQLAYKDGLTGIGNRTAFNERVEAYCALHKQNMKLTVAMFDVNNLKVANDQYGHQKGDSLIKGASKTIKAAFSEIGEAYRVGGDEFVVLVEEICQPDRIELALEELERQVVQFNKTKTCPVPLSIACGYACSDDETDTVDALVHLADERMYENKRKMKGKVAPR